MVKRVFDCSWKRGLSAEADRSTRLDARQDVGSLITRQRNQAPMQTETVHYVGLDVHKETSAIFIAPGDSTEVRRCGIE
jgi:hypothetical protein